jgi:hypothetical protein
MPGLPDQAFVVIDASRWRTGAAMNEAKWMTVSVLGAAAVFSGTLMAQRGMGPGRGGGGMGMGMGMNSVQPPIDNPITAQKVALGKQLYFDGRLSRDGKASCKHATTWPPPEPTRSPSPPGSVARSARATRRPCGMRLSAFHGAQFWDGRAPSLEERAKRR